MTKVKIEKGIPIPAGRGGVGGGIYPWREMKVGDSFLIKGKKGNPVGQPNRVLAPRKFISRKVPGGRRVWRIK